MLVTKNGHRSKGPRRQPDLADYGWSRHLGLPLLLETYRHWSQVHPPTVISYTMRILLNLFRLYFTTPSQLRPAEPMVNSILLYRKYSAPVYHINTCTFVLKKSKQRSTPPCVADGPAPGLRNDLLQHKHIFMASLVSLSLSCF